MNQRKRRFADSRLRAAVLALGLVAALLALNAGSAVGAVRTVRATDDDTWRPVTKEIVKNDKIKWVNPTENLHDIKAYGGNWSYHKSLDTGEVQRRRFKRRGTFKYLCTYHADLQNGVCEGMCGKIRVRRPG